MFLSVKYFFILDYVMFFAVWLYRSQSAALLRRCAPGGMTMERVKNYWRGVPAGSKVAIVTLIGGWVLHAAAYIHFFPADLTDRNVFLQLIVGVGICYGVAAGRKWARMLCVFFNIGIVALYALFSMALVQSGQWGWAGLMALIAGMFSASTVFLLARDSARFFNPQPPFSVNVQHDRHDGHERGEEDTNTR
jgi:uncharacterized membrane protein